MHSLPLFHRLTGRSVLLLGSGVAAEAKRRLLERAGARVTDDATADVQLAFVVLSESITEASVTALKARGVLVNVVDHPVLCDFTTPAIVDRDPVLIAIGTGGASAGLAKALRQRLEQWLPGGLGALANALLTARGAIQARWPEASKRRRAIDAALDPGEALDPLVDHAQEDVARWLAGDAVAEQPERLACLTLLSNDPEDLTLRMARLLGQADAIWHDGSVPPAILDRARADATRGVAATLDAVPVSGLTLWLEMPK